VQQQNDGRKEHRELALADGTYVLVREIQPGDAPALQRLVGRLSEQTIHLRYFGPMKQLSDKQAPVFRRGRRPGPIRARRVGSRE
jgi:hypothetical protein